MKKRILRSIILALLIIVFCISTFMLIFIKIRGNKEQSAFDRIAETVHSSDQLHGTTDDSTQLLSKYIGIYEQNSDFVAWLNIPGTNIDYPVMYTPFEPNHYLHRAFDGSSSVSGTPFIGYGCTPDSDCIIVHGHNMKNGTMFGTLDYYKDEGFFNEHPTVFFDSLYEQREYKIFAAVNCEVVPFGNVGYKYYDHGGNLSEDGFTELVGWLIDNSLYDTGITPLPDSQILLLSTCSYHNTDGRFVVAAYLEK